MSGRGTVHTLKRKGTKPESVWSFNDLWWFKNMKMVGRNEITRYLFVFFNDLKKTVSFHALS